MWEALQVGDKFGASKILQWDGKRCQSYSQSTLLCEQFEAFDFFQTKCVCAAINGRVRIINVSRVHLLSEGREMR